MNEKIKSEVIDPGVEDSLSTITTREPKRNALATVRSHWPEYLMEAGELGVFMFSACAFATVLQHPASPVPRLLPDPVTRRVLMGLAMGLTAVAIVMSPWGKQSGAHFNPSVTLTFWRLKKVNSSDALLYAVAQFMGAFCGVGAAALLLFGAPAHAEVHYAVTMPGFAGVLPAFLAEATISFLLMATILFSSDNRRLSRYTPYLAGALVATFISLEAPISGMSMNPARTLGSAVHAMYWKALWIYFTAPPLGMMAAAELFLHIRGRVPRCAKLHHANNKRCIFRCEYMQPNQSPTEEN